MWIKWVMWAWWAWCAWCLVPGVPGDEGDGLHLLCHPWPLTLAVLAWETLHLLLLSPHLRQSWNGTSRASVKHLSLWCIMKFNMFVTLYTNPSSPKHILLTTSHYPRWHSWKRFKGRLWCMYEWRVKSDKWQVISGDCGDADFNFSKPFKTNARGWNNW